MVFLSAVDTIQLKWQSVMVDVSKSQLFFVVVELHTNTSQVCCQSSWFDFCILSTEWRFDQFLPIDKQIYVSNVFNEFCSRMKFFLAFFLGSDCDWNSPFVQSIESSLRLFILESDEFITAKSCTSTMNCQQDDDKEEEEEFTFSMRDDYWHLQNFKF